MARYRRKAVEVDVMQWNGTVDDAFAVFEFADDDFQLNDDGTLRIITNGDVLQVDHGDWIVKMPNGRCHPCKPATFARNYEQVS